MLVGCVWLGSVCDVIQAAVAVTLLYITWKGGAKAYQQWKNERAAQRSEFFESLMDRFEKDLVHCKVSLADDHAEAEKSLNAVFSDKEKEPEVRSSLRLFSYLCYLRDNGLIEAKEFGMFENTLRRILSNERAQEYICATIKRLGDDDTVYPFQNLLDYAARNHIDIYAAKGSVDNGVRVMQSTVDDSAERSIVEENQRKPPITAKELSQHPVAVIRINRLYRSDMTPMELYDATRGWWRVNLEVACKAKYALSVAQGHVKEVYVIANNGWHKYEAAERTADVESDGRYQFDGEVVKDVSVRQLYVGRSVEGLFKQGDAYPVRYFGINS